VLTYDPFAAGEFEVALETVEALDHARGIRFPVEIWSPHAVASRPASLIVYSHYSGGNRRAAMFLCRHLASHGYVVAAMDHFEVVARDDLPTERADRIAAIIANRVPDVRFLIDYMLARGVDPTRVGLVGHSFGGWTALAVPEVDSRAASVVAMGASGNDEPRPGILPAKLTFKWLRKVPTLYLAAEDDVPIPLAGVYQLFDRTPDPKRMFILRRADHQHFLDDVEGAHETVRHTEFPGEAAWITAAMRPIAELSSGEQAHTFVRGLTLAHLDATLRELKLAERFLDGDVQTELAARGVDAIAPRQ
jgi:dienelactone hydrolase